MPRLTRGEFCWSESGVATIEVIQTARLIGLEGKKCLFIMYCMSYQMINQNVIFSSQIAGFFDH